MSAAKHSLNNKLALIVVAAVMAAVVVVAAGALWQEARRHTQSKLDFLNATASVFAAATSDAVATDNEREALFALRGVARAPHILYARVTDNAGSRLAEIGSGVSLGTDMRYEDVARGSLLTALASRTIQVTQPIMQGGRQVGRITLVADNLDLWPSLLVTLAQTLIAAALALAFAVIVAARLQHWVVRPLLRLTDVVRHISQSHDYDTRVDIDSNDEVGDLCGGFNIMLGEIQDRERRIIDLAMHDGETDLPNRVAFERELGRALAAPRRGALAVAAVGVDRFQYVRGAIGYHLANDLLQELGARLTEFGARGLAARISTDAIAFVIIAADAEHACATALSVVAEVEAPMLLGENAIDVTLGAGLAVDGLHATSPQALIERAIIALDQARARRTKVELFDEAAYLATANNLSLMSDMARAMENGEMTIWLQPKYSLRTQAISGAEVLARWRHPTRGMVPPDLFVGMAEDTGGIRALTDWVLRQALACQARLSAADAPLALAVNISGRLLTDSDFVEATVALLREAAGEIYLEVTETASIDNQEQALRHIEALVSAGARISIDDYGSGLSSLAYLKRIPAQELKIDKAFILSLGSQRRDLLLVKSTIDLAHSLGMQVTAEGVETDEALAELAAMGCDCVQGYLIARPMPEAEFAAFLRSFSPPPQTALARPA